MATTGRTAPYGARDLVFVFTPVSQNFRYGFRTNMPQADRTVLGHQPAIIGTGYVGGLVLGANQPKPHRLAKLTASKGSQSSYCSYGKVATAVANSGWRIVKQASFKRGYPTRLTKAVTVNVWGSANVKIQYAWRMPNWQWDAIAVDRTKLGITECDKNDGKYVWGATTPRPPRAYFTATPAQGRSKKIETFVDSRKIDNLPIGWTAIREKGIVRM